MTDFDRQQMQRALRLAGRAEGLTSPNPMVGAVLVSPAGQVVGEGYHHQAGSPHAEVHALRQAGAAARGGTLYVNLEPCAHHGRTPPCTEAVVAAGVARVVVAMVDPNPLVAGKGIAHLRSAGIEVEVGLLGRQAQRLNEAFCKFITGGRPFVTLKWAMTLDGRIATVSGASRWITGVAARRVVHRLRHASDAVLVGVGSVLADDPQLTVRLFKGRKNPLRVVLDSRLRLPFSAAVLAGEVPTLVVSTALAPPERVREMESRGIEVLIAGEGPRVDLELLLEALGRRGVTSLLVEGGAEVAASFMAAGLVDKVLAFVAPKVFGGRDAPGPLAGAGVAEVTSARPFRLEQVRRVGEDVLLVAYPRAPGD